MSPVRLCGPALPQRVDPRADQDLLAPRALGDTLGPDAHEVVQGALQEDVVPPAEPVGRDVDPLVVLLDVAEALPVGPVVRVADPVPVELADAARALVARQEREVPEERRVVLLGRHPEVLGLVRARVHLDRAPPEVEAELEGAARVDPVVVEVREPHAGRHGREVAVPEGRRQPLGEREVRRAAGAHLPGRPGLRPAPLLRVVAVLGLVDERRPSRLPSRSGRARPGWRRRSRAGRSRRRPAPGSRRCCCTACGSGSPGTGPGPSGRYTSVESFTPSRIGTPTPRSVRTRMEGPGGGHGGSTWRSPGVEGAATRGGGDQDAGDSSTGPAGRQGEPTATAAPDAPARRRGDERRDGATPPTRRRPPRSAASPSRSTRSRTWPASWRRARPCSTSWRPCTGIRFTSRITSPARDRPGRPASRASPR